MENNRSNFRSDALIYFLFWLFCVFCMAMEFIIAALIVIAIKTELKP
jgi:uncharacterized membrane protein